MEMLVKLQRLESLGTSKDHVSCVNLLLQDWSSLFFSIDGHMSVLSRKGFHMPDLFKPFCGHENLNIRRLGKMKLGSLNYEKNSKLNWR